MPRIDRFVYPEEIRLPLSDGDYVDVKKTLNAGEYRLFVFALGDTKNIGPALLLSYLLGWSFVDRHAQPVAYGIDQPEEIRRAAIDNLSPETYQELFEAVSAHHKARETALAEKKKQPATGTLS